MNEEQVVVIDRVGAEVYYRLVATRDIGLYDSKHISSYITEPVLALLYTCFVCHRSVSVFGTYPVISNFSEMCLLGHMAF